MKRTSLVTSFFFCLVGFLPFARAAAAPLHATDDPDAAPLVVMNLAAHPDDEDGSTLAYYRHGRNAIAYSVIFTRGEGGQNEIGPELYEELGAVRTRETERAARRLGTQVFFLNFKDFGFSKSADETFDRWGGRDEVISRLVYMIRKLKPDVLFTNHDTVTVGPDRQHGHHQVVGLSAYQAFELAADPSYHPEQLEEDGVDLWQPKRLFRRLWTDDQPYDVAVPVGRIDPEYGISYAEIAARALHEHASQGMDRFAERLAGWEHTYFQRYRSATDAPISRQDLAANLPPNRAAEPDLTYWIDSGRLSALPDAAIAAGDPVAVPGQTIQVHWDTTGLPVLPVRLELFGAVDTVLILRTDSPASARVTIDRGHPPTVPEKVYQYERFKSSPPLGYAVYDAPTGELKGAGYVDLEIGPPVFIEPVAAVRRLTAGENTIDFRFKIYDPEVQAVILSSGLARESDGRVLDQRQDRLDVETDSETVHSVSFSAGSNPAEGAYTITASVLMEGGTLGPATDRAFVRAQAFDVDVPDNLRVGVIESYDNTLAQALSELDVDHVMIDSTMLARRAFDDLNTIVVDIRAYLVRRDLRLYNDRLLDWVGDGGNLVVNYQKTFEWNADNPDPFVPSRNNPAGFAPYPLQIGRDRVTREDAPVTVLTPKHPIFHEPNPIEASVWDGWVQERGLYFPETYDPRYTELFSLNDPGEEPLSGSTLLARVGDGTYLYTALVWYRQLKEFHPGAYRMFANMISLPLTGDGQATANRPNVSK